MTEGRRAQIVLLDERRLEILIQPKLYAGELLDLVASHINLKEKEYFGLAYVDDTSHYNWLQLDNRVLDHDFPKKTSSSPLTLYFRVKFFVEEISQLKDSVTVEQFYLQARILIGKDDIEVDGEVAYDLTAHSLQITYGDYVEETAKHNLKKLPLLPASLLKDETSITSCEEKILSLYKKLSGLSRGNAIVNYMTILEALPMYGVHYYDVKDKANVPWWLGLSPKGIAQYEFGNKKNPKKVFQWKHLENLYFRDRKFSIEVHDKRVSVSRRTFGPGNIIVLVWFAANPTRTKLIWSMAISQHQFYLDRKQSKNSSNSVRRLSEIAAELSISRQSLSTTSSTSNLSRSESSQSLTPNLPNGQILEDPEQSETAKAARQGMIAVLKARRQMLQEKLAEKTDELKMLCLKEAEIIGELPPEIPLTPGEPRPTIRRRIGTEFTLSENLINNFKSKPEEDMSKLELEYEIQKKIVSAALKLANDLTTKKSVHKQRKLNYQQAVTKLQLIEQRLRSAKQTSHKSVGRNHIKRKQPRPNMSSSELGDVVGSLIADEDSVFASDTVNLSGVTSPSSPNIRSSTSSKTSSTDVEQYFSQSPSVERRSLSGNSSTGLPPSPSSAPTSPTRVRNHHISTATSANRTGGSGGWVSNSPYQTCHLPRTHRCHSEYDNVSNGSSTSSGTFSPHYKNKYDADLPLESRGLYNVPKQRTSKAFYSQEELDDLQDTQPDSGSSSVETYRRHNSVSIPQSRDGESNLVSAQGSRLDSKSMDNLDCSFDCSKDRTNLESTTGVTDRNILKTSEISQIQGDCAPSNLSSYRSQDNLVPFNSIDKSSHSSYNSIGPSQFAYSNFKPQYTIHNPSREQWTAARTTVDGACPDGNLTVHNYLPSVGHGLNSYLSGNHIVVQQTVPFEAINHPLCQSNQSNLSESSQKAKEKEWYETCLDSPVTPRKFPVGYDKSPKCESICSQPSPMRIKKSLFPQNFSHSAAESSNRLSPSIPYEKDSPYLQSSFLSSPDCTLVSMGQFQPYREESKPYELSDYYKYSTKIRKQKQLQLEKQARALDGSVSSLSTNSGRDNNSVCDDVSTLIDYKVAKRGPFHNQHAEMNHHLPEGISPVENSDNFSYNQLRSASISPSPHYNSSCHCCIGPDEAYNSNFGLGFMQQPQQLQGVYQPPRPMACEPLRHGTHITPITSPAAQRRGDILPKSCDRNFQLEALAAGADGYQGDVTLWYPYDDQEALKQATLV